MKRAVLLASLLVTTAVPADDIALLVDDFEGGLRPGWEAKRFQGETEYTVVEAEGSHVLRASSQASASGLVYRLRFDPADYPLLSWRWKVEGLVAGSDPTRKSGDDYAARVYVVFPHWLPPKTRSLNYIWATRPPPEPLLPNPFFGNAMMIAVEAGPERVGRWVAEARDLVADYRRAFGEDPPEAGAVAVMTDTDQTGGSAVAFYDDIRLLRREEPLPSPQRLPSQPAAR